VLACCLIAPAEVVPAALERLGALGEAFYDLRHRTLWQVIAKMAAHTPPRWPELLSLKAQLDREGLLDEAGGLAYIASLEDMSPSGSNLAYFLEDVEDCHLRRRLLAATAQTSARVREALTEGAEVLLNEHTAAVLALAGENKGKLATIEESLEKVLTRLEDIKHGRKQMLGPGTGFNYLDNILCGLKPEEYIVIAGRPGGGKTMLGVQIAEHWALSHKIPVGVFSLEMSQDALLERMVFSLGRAQMQKYRNGFFVNADMPGVLAAVETLRGAAKRGLLNIDDRPSPTIEQLSLRMRQWHRERGCRLFVVDYIQLIRGHAGRRYTETNRAGELAEISMEFLRLKKELKVPIILLAQMNRNIENADNRARQPVLSDLKDCGQIEQDADVVMFLYDVPMQKAIDKPDEPLSQKMLTFLDAPSLEDVPAAWRSRTDGPDGPWSDHLKRQNILVAKQRNGPSGVSAALVRVNQWMRYIDAFTASRGPAPERRPEAQIADEDDNWGREQP